MTLGHRALPEVGEGGHGDHGHRGRLAFGGRTRDGARADVAAAAERLLRLGGATAATRTFDYEGSRLSYLESGAGPPLVLLHGAGGGAANWFGVLAALAARHRVIMPDLPGFGLSDPLHSTGELGRAAVPALEAVLHHAGVERFDMCGTSFGALLALRFAQAAPGRVGRLALLDAAGAGREMPGGLRLAALPLLGRVILARPGERGIRWELRRVVTSLPLPPDREAALVAYLVASARAGDRGWFAGVLRRFVGRGGQREIVTDAELASIRQPTLVLWGERDRFFPASHGVRLATSIPASLLHIVPGSGHSPNWERPAEVAGLLAAFFAA